MPYATAKPTEQRRLPRDSRVDLLRGLALLMIFIDHVPGNFLGLITLRAYGFCDAAELFVMSSGFSSMMAYGGCFARDGVWVGVRRVALRCLRLYVFQVALLVAVLIIVGGWIWVFGVQPESGAPFVHSGLEGLLHGMLLHAQPASLNILPMYIILLALFPLMYGLIRISPWLALVVSGSVWALVNFDPSINLTNWLGGGGWFFNPFAWQFLFVIGALGAVLLRRYDGNLPGPLSLRIVAWSYLGFALVAATPWILWGWSDYDLFGVVPDKTTLAPLRLLNVLALATLALGSLRFRALSEWAGVRFVVVCGKHSLEVFALATILAMICRLAFRTFGVTLATQVLANGLGLGLMIGLALLLERGRRPAPASSVGAAKPLIHTPAE